MTPRPGPTYDLASFQAEVEALRYRVTHSALSGAGELGFDRTDIESCISKLGPGDFYKTMPAESKLGLMQDVYKPTYEGVPIYLKVQHDGTAFVISFKKDEGR